MELRAGHLRQARKRLHLTQPVVAKKLGLSQGYVSLLEGGLRRVPRRLTKRFARLYQLSPTVLPAACPATRRSVDVARQLGALGYPGFSHVRGEAQNNPAEVLVEALRRYSSDPRVVEALPWLLLKYPDLNLEWVVTEAKHHDVQNRLGFVVDLATKLAERHRQARDVSRLHTLRSLLDRSRLAREDDFGREYSTESERNWVRNGRSSAASYWNLVTDVSVDNLRLEKYAG
jgi:transcriptional regulator with XRE-family HTH domain